MSAGGSCFRGTTFDGFKTLDCPQWLTINHNYFKLKMEYFIWLSTGCPVQIPSADILHKQ